MFVHSQPVSWLHCMSFQPALAPKKTCVELQLAPRTHFQDGSRLYEPGTPDSLDVLWTLMWSSSNSRSLRTQPRQPDMICSEIPVEASQSLILPWYQRPMAGQKTLILHPTASCFLGLPAYVGLAGDPAGRSVSHLNWLRPKWTQC